VKNYLFYILLFVVCSGCVSQAKYEVAVNDCHELTVSVENRYNYLELFVKNRVKEYELKGMKLPAWLKLMRATLPSHKQEVNKYKAKYNKEEKK